MPTPKQEKFIKIMLENVGTKGNTKSLGQMLLEAGYEESIAKNPYRILESETVKEGLSETVKKMKKIRNKALKTLDNKSLDEEKPKDVVDIVDKLQKNIQLLSGEETERVGLKQVLVKFIDEDEKETTDNKDTD